MPTYIRRCESCQHTFESVSAIEERDRPVACPQCGSNDTPRIPCAPAVVVDWRDSDSLMNVTRFRPSVENRALTREAS